MIQNPPSSYKIFNLINRDSSSLKNTKILIVGVGGIGCEILKVLCKMPIGSVHIIDMDTIELSNLNRQFLFKKEHKGMSKSLVARQTILKINTDFDIVAHHKNIKELPINFFKQFNFLVMALDNIEARNYVNKIGVRLKIPIIDAGTLGYKGNVTTIIPGKTKCYSCEPKSSQQKVFPVCTIRMRPQKPIHCIVWAKLLFEVIFGPQNQDNDLKDLSQLAQQNDIADIMIKLFQSDILEIKNAKQDSENKLSEMFAKSIKTISKDEIQTFTKIRTIDSFKLHQQKTSTQLNISIFCQSFQRLISQKQKDSVITFQKDDDNIIHFISSAANLRMHCFNIQTQSFNQIKNMAGNIVPAIASTNSIVSGIEIVEMMKLLMQKQDKMKTYFVQNLNNKIIGLKNQLNLPTCQVCQLSAVPVMISTNLESYTLGQLVELIREKSTLQEFSINYGSKEYYNSEEPNENLMEKSIMELCSAYEVDFVITNEDSMKKHCVVWLIHDENVKEGIKLENQEQLAKEVEKEDQENQQILEEPSGQNGQQNGHKQAAQDDDDDVIMFDDESPQLQIIEVKKNPVVENSVQENNHQAAELTNGTHQNGNIELIDDSDEQAPIVSQNDHSKPEAQKREVISIEFDNSSDSIKKRVKPNEDI